MEEMVSVLEEIRDLLSSIDSKLDSISNSGNVGLDDVIIAIDEIKGAGLYNSLTDVCEKIDSLETTITLNSL